MSKLCALRREKKSEEGINLSPLIDMIFILLIFFVVTTTFVQDLEVEIKRPGAATGQKSDTRAIRIAVDRNGRIFIDSRQIREWMIQEQVRSLLSVDPERPVLITADEELPSGRLVTVVDECRLAGAKDVGVDVERR